MTLYLCRHPSFKFRHDNRNCCRCDRVLRLHCKRQSYTYVREHTRHVVLNLLGPHVEVFFSAREHWWLSQAFLVNKHPSRWRLCTIQHGRDCSRQLCKTLCNVLLSSQLNLECSVLIRQSTHLLLQCSQRIFHFWMFGSSTTLSRVGSHARAKGFKSQTVCDLRVTANELHTRPKNRPDTNSCHVTSRHDQRTSSTTRSETRKSQSRSPEGQATRSLPTRNGHGFNCAPLLCVSCMCSVSCAQLSFTLEPDNRLCNTHDECACESSLSMSHPVYRLKASAVQEWHVDGLWLKHNTPNKNVK